METVRSYIEEQRTDEHKRKYTRKSEYWVGKGKSGSVKNTEETSATQKN